MHIRVGAGEEERGQREGTDGEPRHRDAEPLAGQEAVGFDEPGQDYDAGSDRLRAVAAP